MTVLAGVFSRLDDAALPDALAAELLRAISRHPGDRPATYRDQRCLLAKIDVGAYSEPAFREEPPGSVCLLAGEPLLTLNERQTGRSRSHDLEILHRELRRENWNVLAAAHGVFSLAHYERTTGQLTLSTDKLGIRPLYYWVGERYVVFASALRILEGIQAVPKEMDVRAVTEIAAIGFPLGTRTPYLGIRVLDAAEVLRLTAREEIHTRYWRWDAVGPSARAEPELLAESYDRFVTAVTQRLQGDSSTRAFLSGGLDSRCIVAVLRQCDAVVQTINFALWPGMQDEILAAQFAERAGTIHHTVAIDAAAELRLSLSMADFLTRDSGAGLGSLPERPRLVWAGDGGSVGLGHVYITSAIAEHLRAGRTALAIGAFLERQGTRVIRRLLRSGVAQTLSGYPAEGIRMELDRIRCTDPVRAFHVFLMLNDQRRHLSAHFEDIDLHRLELQLPFFDSRLLQLILTAPVDLFLGHRFYLKWLAHLPPAVRTVPWQSYPGHAPCPLPLPQKVGYQWAPGTLDELRRRRRQAILRRARELLVAQDFPDHILLKSRLRAAYWLTRARLGQYDYVIRFAEVFCRYWARSDGTVPSRRLRAAQVS